MHKHTGWIISTKIQYLNIYLMSHTQFKSSVINNHDGATEWTFQIWKENHDVTVEILIQDVFRGPHNNTLSLSLLSINWNIVV